MQKGGVGRPKLLKNAVLALMFMTADVSKPSFYPLPTMTSSIFMPYSLAHAVQDLSCMLSSMALMTTYKRRKWYALLVIVLSTLDFRLSTAKLENILIHL